VCQQQQYSRLAQYAYDRLWFLHGDFPLQVAKLLHRYTIKAISASTPHGAAQQPTTSSSSDAVHAVLCSCMPSSEACASSLYYTFDAAQLSLLSSTVIMRLSPGCTAVNHTCSPACFASPPAFPANCSAIPLPPSDYPLWDSLPAEVVEQGKLSQLQLEGVLYACTRHQQILPSGQRAGFFIGKSAVFGS
jgi:hypothetical protein